MGATDSPNVLRASIENKLWHSIRADLATYIPEIASNNLLMCCACGRFLPQECFDLDHLIPRQTLRQDPAAVRSNPATPANVRSGVLLLCKKPLKLKSNIIYGNGCNSWKGRFYDRAINEMLVGQAFSRPRLSSQVHVISGLCLGYLAMVAEFGYRIVLIRSGLMMREQFFNPRRFHPAMPLMNQLLLGGDAQGSPPDAPMWAAPFEFTIEEQTCIVGIRNFVVRVPLSDDPRQPLAKHLRIAPAKFKLRPDFRTVFD